MKIAIHQPAYLPWLGYFDRIRQSDTFVFLDCVQFEKNSFTNRNRIKTANGPIWLTIPVLHKGHTASTLRDTRIDSTQKWKKKHLNSIFLGYKKAPRFEVCYPKLEKLFASEHEFLSELCHEQLLFWLGELGIRTPVVRASQLSTTRAKSELVLEICTKLNAREYLSGPLGEEYLEKATFEAAGIGLKTHEFRHPSYPQLHGEFVPAMGIVDFWMNERNVA